MYLLFLELLMSNCVCVHCLCVWYLVMFRYHCCFEYFLLQYIPFTVLVYLMFNKFPFDCIGEKLCWAKRLFNVYVKTFKSCLNSINWKKSFFYNFFRSCFKFCLLVTRFLSIIYYTQIKESVCNYSSIIC